MIKIDEPKLDEKLEWAKPELKTSDSLDAAGVKTSSFYENTANGFNAPGAPVS